MPKPVGLRVCRYAPEDGGEAIISFESDHVSTGGMVISDVRMLVEALRSGTIQIDESVDAMTLKAFETALALEEPEPGKSNCVVV